MISTFNMCNGHTVAAVRWCIQRKIGWLSILKIDQIV
jgi:hypothetical protein